MNFFKNFNKRTWILVFIPFFALSIWGYWQGRSGYLKELKNITATFTLLVAIFAYPIWYLLVYGIKEISNAIIEWNKKGLKSNIAQPSKMYEEENWEDETD